MDPSANEEAVKSPCSLKSDEFFDAIEEGKK
jgi:hypothetical protein